MMPLSTPLASAAAGHEDHEATDNPDIYGTFHGRVVPDVGERPRVPGKLWRSVGVAAVLLLLASYMSMQGHYEPAASQVERVGEAENPVEPVERVEEATTTLSHKEQSDGLSSSSKFLKRVDTTEIRKYHRAYASVPTRRAATRTTRRRCSRPSSSSPSASRPRS